MIKPANKIPALILGLIYTCLAMAFLSLSLNDAYAEDPAEDPKAPAPAEGTPPKEEPAEEQPSNAAWQSNDDAAINENAYLCPSSQRIDFPKPDEGGNVSEKQKKKTIGDSQKFYNDNVRDGETECGTINDFSESLEKGDCAGLSITEISEVLAAPTSLDGGENRIIDVYKGLCCYITTTGTDDKPVCMEARSFYAKDFSSCDAKALHCEHRQWIIGSSGAGIIKVYIKQFYGFFAGITGLVLLVTIIISGMQIMISGASGDITSARERITKALFAMALLFLSGILLYTINPTFFI